MLRSITIGGYIASLSAGLLLAGCQTLGPTAVGAGRSAYNDVIARTGSEQTLGLIVRLRYSDPIGLLAVSNVTAGLKFTAEAKTEAGFGPRSNYSGNLVPFSGISVMRTVRRFLMRQSMRKPFYASGLRR